MTEPSDAERSAEACPVCGAHRLTLLYFPDASVQSVRPLDELYGMGDKPADTLPGIGCLNCGSEWPSLEAFRSAS
jgi:hypothetical protein